MASFDLVNYSLRASKGIQRQLVFEGVRKLQTQLDLERLVYIGYGSIWFTDFVLAHRLLEIDDMVSMESDDVGFRRAMFNSPYSTVRVLHGTSSALLPTLYTDESLQARPWLVWLDSDNGFDEALKADVASVVENAPSNTVLLITFNGHEMKYGAAPDRPKRLQDLFGAAVPDNLSKKACKDERMQETLADFALAYIQSAANDLARSGGFVPAFRIIYRDNAPMISVGGILPSRGAARIAASLVSELSWKCRPAKPITAPNLTLREVSVLQSRLPNPAPLDRLAVQALGFDLEEAQLEVFQAYYRQYPSFAQIVA